MTLAEPSIASDLRLTPQARVVLRHLKKFESITPAEALIVYSISRLASCVHEIRSVGYDVATEVRRDAMRHRYARYTISSLAY